MFPLFFLQFFVEVALSCISVFLTHQHAKESPRKLLKIQIPGPQPRISGSGVEPENLHLTSSQVMLMPVCEPILTSIALVSHSSDLTSYTSRVSLNMFLCSLYFKKIYLATFKHSICKLSSRHTMSGHLSLRHSLVASNDYPQIWKFPQGLQDGDTLILLFLLHLLLGVYFYKEGHFLIKHMTIPRQSLYRKQDKCFNLSKQCVGSLAS